MRPDLFISYTRSNADRASRLAIALRERDLSCWLDVERIGGGEVWTAAVRDGIVAASAFVILLDREWLGSRVCVNEFQLALETAKPIHPVVIEPVDSSGWKRLGFELPGELAVRHFEFWHERPDAEVADAVAEQVRTDHPWKRLHARLVERSSAWKESGDDHFGLLRGRELRNVTDRLRTASGKSPAPEQLVLDFVHASERRELEALEASRNRARQRESRMLAVQSRQSVWEDPAASLKQACESWGTAGSPEALQAMAGWIDRHPHLVAIRELGPLIQGVALSDTSLVACQGLDALSAAPFTQHCCVWRLSDRGKVDSLTDIEGFWACGWSGGGLALQRRGTLLSYRYDVFREKFRQTSRGQHLPRASGALRVSPSGGLIALPVGRVLAIQDAHGKRTATVQLDGECHAVAWKGDDELVLAEGEEVVSRSLSHPTERRVLAPIRAVDVGVDSNGQWVAISMIDRARIHTENLEPVQVERAPDPVTSMALSPDGQSLWLAGGGGYTRPDGLVEVDRATGQLLRTMMGGFNTTISAVSVSPAGQVACGTRDGRVFLWDHGVWPHDCLDERQSAVDVPSPWTIEGVKDRLLVNLELTEPGGASHRLSPPSGEFLVPGPVHHVSRGDTVMFPAGAHLMWFRAGDGVIRTRPGHTNPPVSMASLPNGLWASLAISGWRNDRLELLVWHLQVDGPIQRLELPELSSPALAIDEAGEVLMLLQGAEVHHQWWMDPDRWASVLPKVTEDHWAR